MTEMDKLKREFLEYLEIEKGRAIRTVENYEHYLETPKDRLLGMH